MDTLRFNGAFFSSVFVHFSFSSNFKCDCGSWFLLHDNNNFNIQHGKTLTTQTRSGNESTTYINVVQVEWSFIDLWTHQMNWAHIWLNTGYWSAGDAYINFYKFANSEPVNVGKLKTFGNNFIYLPVFDKKSLHMASNEIKLAQDLTALLISRWQNHSMLTMSISNGAVSSVSEM